LRAFAGKTALLRNAYPPGYTPKRTTMVMVPLQHSAGALDDLAAFLK
jgi:hypothetical protein